MALSAEAARKRRVNRLKKLVLTARNTHGGAALNLWMSINALRLTSGIGPDEIGMLPDEPPHHGTASVPHLAPDGHSIIMGDEEIDLSPDQASALQIILGLVATGQEVCTLAGAAGTGKSTIQRVLIQALKDLGRDVVLVSPTNAAARRQQEVTGASAGTIHKLARMIPLIDDETGELMGFVEGEEGGAEVTLNAIVIIDEASMVGRALRDKLTRALPPGTQQIAVGDPCQLPPVIGEPGYDLQHADAMLTQVHRQEAGGALLAFLTWMRTGMYRLDSHTVTMGGGQVLDVTYEELGDSIAAGAIPVVITATNAARWQVNLAARKALRFPALVEGPQVGERVIAYSTTRGTDPVANGEIGTVKVVREPHGTIGGEECWWCVVDFGGVEHKLLVPTASWSSKDQTKLGDPKAVTIPVSRAGLGASVPQRQALIALQPAYAITCHKAQGAQWPGGVIILDTPFWLGEDIWRWGYTAVSRFTNWVQFVRISGMKKVVIDRPPMDLSTVRTVSV